MAKSSSEPQLKLRQLDLSGKVAVVTGASRGIGRGIALNLASRGCSILGTCSSQHSVHLIDSGLRDQVWQLYVDSFQTISSPKIFGTSADILDPSTPVRIAGIIASEFGGRVDIFINNAAMVETAAVGEMTHTHIHNYLMGNIEVPVKIVEELVKQKQFMQNSRIVLISSMRARKAWAKQAMYMATKSAGESLCRAWADAFGGKYPEYAFMAGTTANSVMVGLTRTDAVYNLPPDTIKYLEDTIVPTQSIPRVGEVEDIAEIVGFLCSEQSRWITGSVIGADGGSMMIL